MISSLKLLIAANNSLKQNLLDGLVIHSDVSQDQLMRSPSITTALLPLLGYKKASELAWLMKSDNLTVAEANDRLKLVEPERLLEALKPENLLKLGYLISDI